MTLDNEANWQTVYNGFHLGTNESPIDKILIPTSLTQHTIRIYTTSLQAKPTWWLAGRLIQLINNSGIDFEGSRWAVPLNRLTLLQLPLLTSDYRLKFEPVRWVSEIALTVEIYNGS